MGSKSPVSLLQEILVQSAKPQPHYSFIQLLDNKTLQFECTVTVGIITATGKASSKKQAKQLSAEMILRKLEFTHLFPIPTINTIHKNSVAELNNLSSRNKLPYATYITECISEHLQSLHFTIKCQFGSLEACGTATNKKNAKHEAASEILTILKTRDLNSVFRDEDIDSTPSDVVTTSEVDKLVQKLYKQYAFNQQKKSKLKVLQENLQPATKMRPVDYYKLDTIEEVNAALAASEVTYNVQQLQEKPLVLMLEIKGTNQVIMEIGDVYKDVLFCLLKKSLIIYNYNKEKRCVINRFKTVCIQSISKRCGENDTTNSRG